MVNARTERFPLSLCLVFAVGSLGTVLLPVVVGALAAHGLPAKALGMLGFLEFAGTSLGAVLCTSFLNRASAIKFASVGVVLVLLGNLMSVFALTAGDVILFGRALAGFGGGLMMAGSLAGAAGLGDPARTYALMSATAAVLSVIAYVAGPYLAQIASGRGVFLFSVALALITLAAIAFDRAGLGQQDRGSGVSTAASAVAGEVSRRVRGYVALLALAVLLSTSMADSSVWAFAIPMGKDRGASDQLISYFLVASSLCSFAGSMTVSRIGDRCGFTAPLTIGFIGAGIMTTLMILVSLPITYGVVLCLRVLCLGAIYPLILGVFAELDPTGRIGSAAAATMSIGFAIGPLMGGYLVDLELRQFWHAVSFAVMAFALSLGLLYLLIYHQNRAQLRSGLVS